jgi:hypothetical protein
MHVQREPGNFAAGGNHQRADRDVGDKVAIHHIDMDKIRTRRLYLLNLRF